MQKYPRLVSYSYLGLQDLIKVSSMNKFERNFVINSHIIRHKNGGKLDCEIIVGKQILDEVQMAGLKLLIHLSDNLTLKVTNLSPQ